MARHPDAYVELVSDGTRGGTYIWLVLNKDGSGARFVIPYVLAAEFSIGEANLNTNERADGTLTLTIGNVHVKSTVVIGPGKSTVEDLLAEMAAAGLLGDKHGE